MSLNDPRILPALYDSLATPPISSPHMVTNKRHPLSRYTTRITTPGTSASNTPSNRSPTSALNLRFDLKPIPLPNLLPKPDPLPPLGSLMPAQFHIPPIIPRRPNRIAVDIGADSLTREKKGKMPTLSHLLSVGGGERVLSLAADERYVYAGCQSAHNEIVVC